MESLLFFQRDLASKINKAKSNFRKSPKDRITKEYLESKLESLDNLWFEFLSGHKELMKTCDIEKIKSSTYVSEDVYENTEEMYIDYKCQLKAKLNSMVGSVQQSISLNKESMNTSSTSIKLPKISLPAFSGKYTEWISFRNMFISLIHNTPIDDIQKLHYLKGSLTGEAEQLLRHISISGENYNRPWQLLEERYNNKKYLSQCILKRMLGQKNAIAESATYLKELMDTTTECLEALSNIGIDISSWDIIVIYIISLKLDPETRKQWELNVASNTSSDSLPTYQQFRDFLTARYRALEFVEPRVGYRASNSVQKQRSLHVNTDVCPLCSEDHCLGSCKQFVKRDYTSRHGYVQSNGLCFNCLGNGHSARFCSSKSTCRICRRRHHTLLHPEASADAKAHSIENNVTSNVAQEQGDTSDADEVKSAEINDDQISNYFSSKLNQHHVLLPTAVVNASSKCGSKHTLRALLDQGSQASFVTEATVQLLGLRRKAVKGVISGLGGDKNITSKATVSLRIQSILEPKVEIQVKAYVLKSVTSLLPSRRIVQIKSLNIPQEELADKQYYLPSKIDLLLGADIYAQIIRDGIRKDTVGSCIAQQTSLGWIISGVANTIENVSTNITVMHLSVNENDILKRFWEIESDLGSSKDKLLTEEEKKCEELFNKTTFRDIDGRYVVKLPFRVDCPEVANSREIAVKRLKSLEHKLNKNLELKTKYNDVIMEYLTLGHMEEVPMSEVNSSKAVYLPHHAVVRDDKDTTRLRVVFDASCKGENNVSLNDTMMIGPTLQEDLRHLMIRWRCHPICIVADIVKMYRQIKVQEQDTNFQRILWRASIKEPIKEYRLLRVTFGTASAPYLAVKSLQQIAYDEGKELKESSQKILRDFYMDDLMTGCQTVEEGVKVYQEMNTLLNKGQFYLQKWSSNSEELLMLIKEKGITGNVMQDINIKFDSIIKIIGLTWDREADEFSYTATLRTLEEPVTKRLIISDISRLFDPLGWIAPCIIKAKILIQKLWLAGIGWDDKVPETILKEWLTYRDELSLLSNVRVPRWLNTRNCDARVDLHGFCDASKLAYAAVIYVRVVDSQGAIRVNLVTARTKVAPIKQVSIPRLELCGAMLLTRLLVEVSEVMNIPKTNIYAWTDSTVVLAWLNDHPSRWKTFVANRVAEIVSSLDPQQWSHIPSTQNPADCASRGINPADMSSSKIWWRGPSLLRREIIEHKKPENNVTELEIAKSFVGTSHTSEWIAFSSLSKLIRVIAYCRRFLLLLKPNCVRKKSIILESNEINDAIQVIIKNCQEEHFRLEKDSLINKNKLPTNSNLRSLDPFLDQNGILRVGGRLELSSLKEDTKHPIILPKSAHLTSLIIKDAHFKTLHGGPQLMVRFLCAKYWIIGVKQLARGYVRKCVRCIRYSAPTIIPKMGQLPPARVTPTRPFKHSGVDYAGPISIRTTKGRGQHSYKGYICLFVCMATRAVHVEAVCDLTSQGFLAAFKRFVARRGHCSDLWSDNGTNFCGASKELNSLFTLEKSGILPEIVEGLANNNTTWHFIPPHAPNFGGLWEAGIKSVKYHLKRVIGNSTLTFEEITTVLAQVEACLNSRPLSRLESNSDAIDVLTPGHFLVGEPLITAPDQNFETSNISTLRRWQFTQRMLQEFWRRWSSEYLTRFLQRYKWREVTPEPNIGDIVLIKEDDLPPCRWLYGRIIQKHPGADNITRVVTIRTKNSSIKRPVSKICVLPITE